MKLAVADCHGRVYDHPGLFAIGRSGDLLSEVFPEEWIPLPEGATLVSLPGTRAVGIDGQTGEMAAAEDDFTAVGALLPQGYTRLYLPAYVKKDREAPALPLFGYTAVAWHDGRFYVAAEETDDPARWNPDNCDPLELEQGIDVLRSRYPGNRLYEHLSHCAQGYSCLTASNTFLGRWEGAVPVSMTCNAGCFGCISEQPEDGEFPSPQTRIAFMPTVDEVVEVMLEHLQDEDRIISFGQGCEGEPSTQAKLIIEAIRRVRAITDAGYININTNAGLTDHIRGIVDAGLDLIRVSTISAIEEHYNAYYRPRAYTLANVEKSLRYAVDNGVYASINYLVFPGVTDREEELEAMIGFARRTGLHVIQMRNLNIDPDKYLSIIPKPQGEILGMKRAMEMLREELPGVRIGSYTHAPGKRTAGARRTTRQWQG